MEKKDDKPDEQPKANSEVALFRTTHGAPFWRGGILFDGDWREVKRDEVGEMAWQRIVAEPRLQRQQAA